MLAYSMALVAGLLLSAPWWMVRMATTERYREGLAQRLGRVPAALRAYAAGKRVVWLHAVSVGEMLAASRLVAELEQALGDGWCIVISTTTRTGQALARERFGTDRVFYMPLDFGWCVRRYLRALQPAALVLMESELWPRLLHEAARRNIPRLVVNARVSDRSYRRALKVRNLWKHTLAKVSLFLAQSEEEVRRLQKLGALNVRAIGNLKYEVRATKESTVADLILNIAAGRPIVVAGSTVGSAKDGAGAGEEGWLQSIWGGVSNESNGALLVVAPRHPERFPIAWETFDDYATVKASELIAGREGTQLSYTRNDDDRRPEVVLLDTIGDLAGVYRIATVAFVGGSLVKKGGHNPLEPAQFGVPIIMGPSYENFRDIVSKLRDAHAIFIIDGKAEEAIEPKTVSGLCPPEIYAMRDSLQSTIKELLSHPEEARAMGERGRKVFESQQGATASAVEEIVKAVQH